MNERKEDQFVELSQEELKSVRGGSPQPQPWIVVGTAPIVVGTSPVVKPAVTQPQPW